MPPEFWWRPPHEPSVAARLLAPAAALVSAIGARRHRLAEAERVDAPVICVGNLVAGGAGKTPTVRAICERLAIRGLTPSILSRGYGGRLRGPHRVDVEADAAADVGDEPLMLARDHPVWIGADRRATARAALLSGADALVMDDGFQNPRLHKDLSILVIDAGVGHGNERVIPAGPLREPLEVGFARADCAVVIGRPPPGRTEPKIPDGAPALRAHLAPALPDGTLAGRPLLAFAGIGRPSKFFQTLDAMGAKVLEREAFPDHHQFSSAILTRLERRAKAIGASLATTEKDAARLPRWFRDRVIVVPVRLGFSDFALLDALIDQTIERVRSRLLSERALPRQPRRLVVDQDRPVDQKRPVDQDQPANPVQPGDRDQPSDKERLGDKDRAANEGRRSAAEEDRAERGDDAPPTPSKPFSAVEPDPSPGPARRFKRVTFR